MKDTKTEHYTHTMDHNLWFKKKKKCLQSAKLQKAYHIKNMSLTDYLHFSQSYHFHSNENPLTTSVDRTSSTVQSKNKLRTTICSKLVKILVVKSYQLHSLSSSSSQTKRWFSRMTSMSVLSLELGQQQHIYALNFI